MIIAHLLEAQGPAGSRVALLGESAPVEEAFDNPTKDTVDAFLTPSQKLTFHSPRRQSHQERLSQASAYSLPVRDVSAGAIPRRRIFRRGRPKSANFQGQAATSVAALILGVSTRLLDRGLNPYPRDQDLLDSPPDPPSLGILSGPWPW